MAAPHVCLGLAVDDCPDDCRGMCEFSTEKDGKVRICTRKGERVGSVYLCDKHRGWAV